MGKEEQDAIVTTHDDVVKVAGENQIEGVEAEQEQCLGEEQEVMVLMLDDIVKVECEDQMGGVEEEQK